jgi:hypothetical protein
MTRPERQRGDFMKPARLLATLTLCLILLAVGQAQARDFFISPGKARPQGYVMVAKGGAPFSSIQAALDSITDASSAKVYMVMVGPGVYQEQVTLKPFVGVMGAGQGVTVIAQPGSDSATFATVLGADSSRLSNLTVRNTGGASYDLATAILLNGVETELFQVAVEVTADGATDAWGVKCVGLAEPLITQSKVTVSGAADNNIALYALSSSPILRWCELTAGGGGTAQGVNLGEASVLTAQDLTVLVSDGDNYTYGIYCDGSSSFDFSRLKVTAASDVSTFCYGLRANGAGGIIKRGDFSVSGASSTTHGLSISGVVTELYHMNVRVDGSGSHAKGLTTGSIDAAASLRMEHFSFEVAGGATSRYGISSGYQVTMNLANGTLHLPASSTNDVIGLVNNSTNGIITAHNVSVSVPQGTAPYSVIAVRNTSQESVSLYNCDLETGGIGLSVAQGSFGETTTTTLVNSRLMALYGLENMDRCNTFLGSSLLKSDYYVTGGSVYCFGCYDETMAAACH